MTEFDNEYATPEPETSGLEIEPTRYSQESVSPSPPVEEKIPPVVEPEPAPQPEEPKKANKVRRFLRNLLRWILGLLIVFGFGFLTAVFVIYRPELQAYQEQLNQTSVELTTVQEQLVENETTYQNSIAELEDQVAALQQERS